MSPGPEHSTTDKAHTVNARHIVIAALGTLGISMHCVAATTDHRAAVAARSSYIIKAPSLAVALAAVRQVGGAVTHELGIIDAVGGETHG
jgi:hypothetical protein